MKKNIALILILPTLLLACIDTQVVNPQSGTSSGNGAPVTDGNWYKPAPLSTWSWQLQGDINTAYNVDIYDIDLFDSSVQMIQSLQSSGARVICYFSAGSYEAWRSDAGDFHASDLGNTLDGWPDERWLDIRSVNVRAIMAARLELAKQKGCDGVEPDNVDGYTNNPGFNFTASDQIDFNRYIANQAHLQGLAVALKNDLDQVMQLVDYFDFAVNEQCFQYNECDLLDVFIQNNKAVLNAEYRSLYVNDAAARNQLCVNSINKQFSTLVLPIDLDDQFRLSCL